MFIQDPHFLLETPSFLSGPRPQAFHQDGDPKFYIYVYDTFHCLGFKQILHLLQAVTLALCSLYISWGYNTERKLKYNTENFRMRYP